MTFDTRGAKWAIMPVAAACGWLYFMEQELTEDAISSAFGVIVAFASGEVANLSEDVQKLRPVVAEAIEIFKELFAKEFSEE